MDNQFEQLYKAYYPKLSAYASFYLKNDEAHDVVQDVFLSLLEKNKNWTDTATLNAFLYKAVQNKCIDAIRHKAVKNQYASAIGKQLLQMESDYLYTSRNEIEEGLFSQELQDQIDAAVEPLPPKGKEVFKLYFFQRKSADEVASALGITRSTVENHIYTCLKTIRKKLIDYIIFFFFFL